MYVHRYLSSSDGHHKREKNPASAWFSGSTEDLRPYVYPKESPMLNQPTHGVRRLAVRPARVFVLVLGCLLILPAVGLLLGGGVLGVAAVVARDDDGYFDATIELATNTAAVTAEEVDLISEPGSPDWIIDALDVDIRLRVTGNDAGDDLFVGIARERDVDRYLAGTAHAEIRDVDGRTPTYRIRSGDGVVGPPGDQEFWVATASGVGTQEVFWEAQTGRWAAVVMNTDGSPGVVADVNVGAKSGIVVGLSIALLAIGTVLSAAAVALIVSGAKSSGPPSPPATTQHATTPVDAGVTSTDRAHPVSLTAGLDPELSRAMWLVKWLLAIPHFIVLTFLWIAFVVLTVVAGIAILFTGRYPRGIFDFNVGVLRWSWRVQFYAWSGGIGTDTYPPFSLNAEPADLAQLDVVYPEQLNRPLVLVKWLLAIPHLVIVGLLVGTTVRWPDTFLADIAGGVGLLGVLTLLTGLILLITNEYPRSLFDMIVGLNRWIYRVVAYVALMTDDYPPFRLDQGGSEPAFPNPPPPPPQGHDASDPIDLRSPTESEAPQMA